MINRYRESWLDHTVPQAQLHQEPWQYQPGLRHLGYLYLITLRQSPGFPSSCFPYHALASVGNNSLPLLPPVLQL
ncbi:hypothetical protein AMECASPLE_009892 [Ameca splendens]|uniref:Uncharacterized protein n=1 Tax=Ameca splendens TaxID=208324 RepID=A0ABV1A6N6_9TELE